MSDLLALTSYYSDQDTPPEITSNQKKLHLWLTKIELIKKLEKTDDNEMLDRLMQELEMINITGLLQFVRDKAMESGDLSLQHIEGDSDKW